MPALPITDHSWESTVDAIPNVDNATAESGMNYPYLLSEKTRYNVTLMVPIVNEPNGDTADALDAFYNTNKLSETVSFTCKGYNYVGHFTGRPVSVKQRGFGRWLITIKLNAERIGRVS